MKVRTQQGRGEQDNNLRRARRKCVGWGALSGRGGDGKLHFSYTWECNGRTESTKAKLQLYVKRQLKKTGFRG